VRKPFFGSCPKSDGCVTRVVTRRNNGAALVHVRTYVLALIASVHSRSVTRFIAVESNGITSWLRACCVCLVRRTSVLIRELGTLFVSRTDYPVKSCICPFCGFIFINAYRNAETSFLPLSAILCARRLKIIGIGRGSRRLSARSSQTSDAEKSIEDTISR